MRASKLILQTWLTTSGAVALAVGNAAYNTCALLAIALEPKREPRKKAPFPKPPNEGTWWERSLGIQERD